MIEQMRVLEKQIAKILDDFPGRSESWQFWLDYQGRRLAQFQAHRQTIVTMLAPFLTVWLWSLLEAGVTGNAWLWLGVFLLGAVIIAFGTYLVVYNSLLHRLEAQAEELFEKTLSIETRPTATVVKYVFDWVCGWLENKSRGVKVKDLNVW